MPKNYLAKTTKKRYISDKLIANTFDMRYIHYDIRKK